jgi:hypothetical protein
MMLSPDSRQCVSIQPRVLFLSMPQQWVSEWVSESMLSSLWEQQHTHTEKERENKFGNGSVDWESKESWISVTHYQDWNLDTAKVNDQVDNCPIWIQIGFVLFWDSSQVYDYSSTVVIVFVCEWMRVSYLCKFSQGRDWKRRSKVREREREPCHTLFHPATTAWWNMTSADQDNVISSTFLSWSAFISRLSFISHMMSLLNLCTHLTSSPTPTLIYFSNCYYKPPKKQTYYSRVRF